MQPPIPCRRAGAAAETSGVNSTARHPRDSRAADSPRRHPASPHRACRARGAALVLFHRQPTDGNAMTRNAAETAPRLYFLDWIRIFAFILLVFYHTGMYYVTWDFHIKSPRSEEHTSELQSH